MVMRCLLLSRLPRVFTLFTLFTSFFDGTGRQFWCKNWRSSTVTCQARSPMEDFLKERKQSLYPTGTMWRICPPPQARFARFARIAVFFDGAYRVGMSANRNLLMCRCLWLCTEWLPLFPLFPVFPLFFDGAERGFERKNLKLLMCWIAYRSSWVYNSTFVLCFQGVFGWQVMK